MKSLWLPSSLLSQGLSTRSEITLKSLPSQVMGEEGEDGKIHRWIHLYSFFYIWAEQKIAYRSYMHWLTERFVDLAWSSMIYTIPDSFIYNYPLVNVYKKLWKITIFHGKIHDISTGPVMYTKCLVDSGMPISIAAQELLYPVPWNRAQVDSQLTKDGLKMMV